MTGTGEDASPAALAARARLPGWRVRAGSPVPESVARACALEDWAAHLPARAQGRRWRLEQAVKRGVDLAGATLLGILLLPLFLLLAALVRLTSPGPALYRLHWLGLHGRPFVGYKLRTMVANADELKRDLLVRNEMTSAAAFKIREDPRVTPLGRFLRRYSLDEIPQLWNVVMGDLSLVGPRAPTIDDFQAFEPWQRAKLAVKPGLTCFWQVSGRADITDFGDWVRLDLRYIREWSLALDLRLLLRTLPAVLGGHGAY